MNDPGAPTLQMPTLTALDAVTQGVAAIVYLGIGVAAWLRAPRDARTQVFLAASAVNAVAFGLPAISWMRGALDPLNAARWELAALLSALGLSALLLLHFMQVFPRRRPWIRGAPWQLPAGYLLTPLVIGALVVYWPNDVASLSTWYVVAAFVFGFPLLVTLGVVVPVAGILSLVKSYREAETYGAARLKTPLLLILISQVAGGTLALVFAPVLAVLAPNSTAQDILTLTIWALGLLTPLGFAAAIWRYDALSVPLD
jgi:hypothetical protein